MGSSVIDKSGVKGAVSSRWLPTVLYVTAFRCSFPAPKPGLYSCDAVGCERGWTRQRRQDATQRHQSVHIEIKE